MECTLMHKHTPVADILITEENGYIDKIGKIHNPGHLPVGTMDLAKRNKDRPNRAYLNDWWLGRSIPSSRDKLKAVLSALGLRTASALALKCCGLSLSDQYWVCPKDSGFEWSSLNFFQNNFSTDIGEMLFDRDIPNVSHINLMSPDNTSDGWLRKKWVVRNGERFLMKGGSGVFEQEPLNEAVASAVMRRLNIPHVPYTLVFDGGKPYSLCKNFVTVETDLVPAWRVMQTRKKLNSESDFTHLLRCCEDMGIPGVQPAMDKMLTLDCIIANEDRHYNNFGVLRNAESLEWIGLAPVYDSGTSLWYNTQRVGSEIESKPFKKTHTEQIKLVRDFDWFDFDALDGIDEECGRILAQSELISPERAERIAYAVKERTGRIGRMK